MMAAVFLALGVLGLVWVAWLLARETESRVRVAAAVGVIAGFGFALLAALALQTEILAALATATLGAAVLALALIGQWRMIQAIVKRR